MDPELWELQPNDAEARAKTDIINSPLSGTGEREREGACVCGWDKSHIKTYMEKRCILV